MLTRNRPLAHFALSLYNRAMLRKERRKHPRIEVDVTVEVYASPVQMTEPEMVEICSVINLSESGMRFMTRRRFKDGQLLRLTFLLPDSMIIIRTDAKVIHRHRKSDKNTETGVEFVTIRASDKKLIRHVVNRMLCGGGEGAAVGSAAESAAP